MLEGIQNTGDASECRESLEHYRQKLTLYRHQIEEQLESISEVTTYSERQIDSMLSNFELFLRNMWEEAESPLQANRQMGGKNQKDLVMTVKNIHQILPKGVAYEDSSNKCAFRNLE